MARVVQQTRFESSDTLRPDAPNEEFEESIGEMNGRLDRDNVDNQLIIGSRVEVGIWNTVLHLELAGGSVTRNNANDQQWIPIMSGTLTTGDGRIQVDAEYSYHVPGLNQVIGNNSTGADLGIRIDGGVVSRSGTVAGSLASVLQACTTAPVGPGDHLVEAVVRIAPSKGPLAGTWDNVGGMVLARFLGR